VREESVEADRDAEAGQEIADDEDRDVAPGDEAAPEEED
jgi:hypothetical protein